MAFQLFCIRSEDQLRSAHTKLFEGSACMPQLGNDRFRPHIHAAEYVGSFIYKDVFCSCRIGQHLFTASDVFFSWDKRISQQMYMDIQVKISLQLIIQNAETVAYVRQTKLNKNDFSFIDRLILMCIVCSRQCLIEKLVFSLSAHIFLCCFYRRKFLNLLSSFPVNLFHCSYYLTHPFSPS